jgi:thioredoxin reductase
MPNHPMPNAARAPHDVVVIGGGPAGLQAALTLGRVRRQTLLLDSGEYRNSAADAIHNMITRDGTTPAEFRAKAHAELAGYSSVEVRAAVASTVVRVPGIGFIVRLTDGSEVAGRTLLLATGLRDQLPLTRGLSDLFGNLAAHCPYCHGYEYADTHVAVLGSGPQVPRMALLMERVASRLTVMTDGGDLDPEHRAILSAANITVRPEAVKAVSRTETGVAVSFAEGPDEEVGGVLVATTWVQSAPFAEQLGLSLLPSGCTEVDPVGRTGLRGVYAAGDAAHTAATPIPLSSVVAAAAAGKNAAMALDADLLTTDHGLLPPGAHKGIGKAA